MAGASPVLIVLQLININHPTDIVFLMPTVSFLVLR